MAKIALFFVLEKPTLPDNFGIKMSLPAIAPFYESIARDASITKLNYSDCTAYNFRFFRKPFRTDVLVVVREFDYHSGSDIEDNCRRDARGILELTPNKDFDLEAYTQRALWLPKGVTRHEFNTLAVQFSKTADVDPEKLVREDTSGGWMMSHPDGFLLGSKNEADFLRAAAFNALAMAYQVQAEEGLNRLASASATAGSQLPKLCEDLSRFQCQYSFINPLESGIANSANSYVKEYGMLAKHLRVSVLLTELDHKVTQALNLLQSRLMNKGNIDDMESFSVEPRQAKSTTKTTNSDTEAKASNRFLLALIIIAVAGAAFYFVATDQGQERLDTWLNQTPLASLNYTEE